MKWWWRRDVFQIVDKWACREGSPEDDDEKKVREARCVDSASPATSGPQRSQPGDRPDGIFPTITTNHVPRPNNACRRGLGVASSNTNQMSDMMAGSSRRSVGLDAHIIRDEEAVIDKEEQL